VLKKIGVRTSSFFWEKDGKVGIFGITNIKSEFKDHAIRYGILFFGLLYSIVLLGIFLWFREDLPYAVGEFVLISIIIIGFALFLSIFIDDPINYHRCVKHSEKVIPIVKDAVERMCSCEFELKRRFSFKFPAISHYDVNHLKKHLGIDEKGDEGGLESFLSRYNWLR